jgi:hypothetical protein
MRGSMSLSSLYLNRLQIDITDSLCDPSCGDHGLVPCHWGLGVIMAAQMTIGGCCLENECPRLLDIQPGGAQLDV